MTANSVAIDTLSLSWLDGQSIRGVEILDPTGKTVGRLEEVSTEISLLNVMQKDLSLGQTTIRGLNAELLVDESGANNLSQAPRAEAALDASRCSYIRSDYRQYRTRRRAHDGYDATRRAGSVRRPEGNDANRVGRSYARRRS